jgi:hypothetical protein
MLTDSALDNLIFDVDRSGVSVPPAERTGCIGDDGRITHSPEDALLLLLSKSILRKNKRR